jgi:hypothetical protein
MAQYIGQVTGEFTVGENIVETLIQQNARRGKEVAQIVKIGIQADCEQSVYLNNTKFQIGKTGILQFSDVNITSIVFDTHPYKILINDNGYFTNAIIDYIYEDNKQGKVVVKNSFSELIGNQQNLLMQHTDNENS